ncbi:MAG: hypothetical protein MUD01_18635 [Chloroflexaceae bacterium]|jgi:formate hydrogenlyase subunit 3/multisubunit Na+/H+ antiporter MnhD subunit|nr:hypothetical protein [Chloroflexaceae bacterium]
MLYILLILFPVSMAASCFVLRKRSDLVVWAALAALVVQALLVAQIPLDAPSRLFGITLTLNGLNRLFMFIFVGACAVAFVASWHLPHGENFFPVMLLILALVCSILLLQDLFIVSLLLIGAGLVAVLAIVDLPTESGMLVGTRSIGTALKYLVLMALASVLMYFSFVLADIYRPGELPGRVPLARFILVLMALGFAFRLALVPFHTWLLNVVEDAAPMVSALLVALLNSTSLLVLVLAFQSFPMLLDENAFALTLLRVGALATSLVGAVLALNQPTIRRTVAYLIIYNCGMVFYGLATVSEAGLQGAIFEAFNQAIGVMLIFLSLGWFERADVRQAVAPRRDLLRRWPVAGLGLLGGGVALLGLPPLSGFASKMLIYESAMSWGVLELSLLLLATALALLGLARMARDWLLGPSEDAPTLEPAMLGATDLDAPFEPRVQPQPFSSALLTVLLLLFCVGIGLYPQPLLNTIGEVIRSFAFVRVL